MRPLIWGRAIAWALDAVLWLGLAALALSAFAYHVQVCSFPYQLDPNEGGTLQSVRALQAGGDPWSPELAPEYVNMYGISYPLLVAVISRTAPRVDLLLLMRLVTAGALFLGLGLAYLALRGAACPALPAAAACVALYTAWLFYDTLSARADGLVAVVYLVALVWAWEPGYGNAIVAGVLAGSAYFVKPYGLLALPLVPLALWLQSRRRHAAAALAAGIMTLLAMTAWVLWRFPHYFECTFMHHFHQVGGFKASWMLAQWKDLAGIYWPLWLGVAAVCAHALWRRRGLFPPGPWRAWASLAALALAVLACGPGGHTGAWLTYYNHLWVPVALIAATLFLLSAGLGPRWVAVLLALSAVFGLRFDLKNCPPNTAEETRAWAQADAWVAEHPFSMLPPILNSIAIKHHAFIAETEHSHGLALCYAEGHTQLKDSYERRMAWIYQQLHEGRFQSLVCGGNWACPDGAAMAKLGYHETEPIELTSPLLLGILQLRIFIRDGGTRRVIPKF